jgi:hypothetical protein
VSNSKHFVDGAFIMGDRAGVHKALDSLLDKGFHLDCLYFEIARNLNISIDSSNAKVANSKDERFRRQAWTPLTKLASRRS